NDLSTVAGACSLSKLSPTSLHRVKETAKPCVTSLKEMSTTVESFTTHGEILGDDVYHGRHANCERQTPERWPRKIPMGGRPQESENCKTNPTSGRILAERRQYYG